MVNTTIKYENIIIINIVAWAPASTRPDPRGRGLGQDPRGRGHKILASRGLEAEARPRGLTSLLLASIHFVWCITLFVCILKPFATIKILYDYVKDYP